MICKVLSIFYLFISPFYRYWKLEVESHEKSEFKIRASRYYIIPISLPLFSLEDMYFLLKLIDYLTAMISE